MFETTNQEMYWCFTLIFSLGLAPGHKHPMTWGYPVTAGG